MRPGTFEGAHSPRSRIVSIDALRGLVMLLMLVDHVREFVYLHAQVRDPMDLSLTPPDLVMTRLISHLCAPVFILLTGLSASLHAQKHGDRRATSVFLAKRGLLLILMEVTLVSLAWTRSLAPPILYLQVIWAIGLSMVALAALLWLPRAALIVFAAAVMLGHNLLDGFVLQLGDTGYVLWSILHQRGFIELPWGVARTSYPVLPWFGVIAAGYALGPLFAGAVAPAPRRKGLLAMSGAALIAFVILRGLNGYGEPVPWQTGATILMTALSFVNLTKYPPSADFLLLTLGLGLGLLALFEAVPVRSLGWLRTFGGAPLFFYLAHLWLLRLLHDGALALGLGDPSGRIEAGAPVQIWLVAAALAPPLWLACRWMVGLKRRAALPALSYL
ncbi:heparan-alpha-glucosaminide N-acetyltransferase domain-containing protein [Methylobacterium sp. Leaf88]|uniref:DUF1624 domain-containing protein n=1 Tax=Methylobacterium sp. Leaf88 TaxID=1736244 RepID=UPI0006F59BC1|nr:heparan-alpha-glucosaminide N-acetyltransferase domain-containing protein [Methylobacterium sp. Leaf88]KQO70652.1 hypothetical protein ASF20_19345 [Methylobacterium sp. Leaf88]